MSKCLSIKFKITQIMSGLMKNKKERTILILGSPHSGKTVFSFLLFFALNELGNDCELICGDAYSPPKRKEVVNEGPLHEFIYTLPYNHKVNIPHKVYKNNIDFFFKIIRRNGKIVLDGIGMHDESTEFLLSNSSILIVLCSGEIQDKDLVKNKFIIDDKPVHPFEFYKDTKKKIINITTYLPASKKVSFDPETCQGQLCSLIKSRDRIVGKVPKKTIKVIKEIADFILDKWR